MMDNKIVEELECQQILESRRREGMLCFYHNPDTKSFFDIREIQFWGIYKVWKIPLSEHRNQFCNDFRESEESKYMGTRIYPILGEVSDGRYRLREADDVICNEYQICKVNIPEDIIDTNDITDEEIRKKYAKEIEVFFYFYGELKE